MRIGFAEVIQPRPHRVVLARQRIGGGKDKESPRLLWLQRQRPVEILDRLVVVRELQLRRAGVPKPGRQQRIARAQSDGIEDLPQPLFRLAHARQGAP